MPMLVKQLKPQRLKDKEMRLALLTAINKAARDIRRDYLSTVETWEHKPEFAFEQAKSLQGGPQLLIEVSTTDEIYGYVDKGTRGPYPIPKAGPGLLRFSEGYTAKTVPGTIRARPGGRSGGDVFVRGQVLHPGIDARHFERSIDAKWQEKYPEYMEEGMRQARKASGNEAP